MLDFIAHESDLRLATAYAGRLADGSEGQDPTLLSLGTVIAYAKPFVATRAMSLKVVRVRAGDALAALRPAHDTVVELRNQAVAHSEVAGRGTTFDVISDLRRRHTDDLVLSIDMARAVYALAFEGQLNCSLKIRQLADHLGFEDATSDYESVGLREISLTDEAARILAREKWEQHRRAQQQLDAMIADAGGA